VNRTIHPRLIVTLGLATAAIAYLAPVSALAQQRPGGGAGAFANNPGMRLWNALDQRFDDFAGQLSLTEAQTELATMLVASFREENEGTLRRYDRAMSQMRERMRGGNRGGAARRGGAQRNRQGMQRPGGELRAILQDLGPAFETLHADVTAILDEDQADRLRELLARQRPGS